ncbi:beta strand repeat-containing protein [Klebsiella michiganensis]|uniref:beta strand repeat-containing protein n=1 Tax=Klebsiella michiganensis TaxID=1134687 RepID=UPI003D6E79A2
MSNIFTGNGFKLFYNTDTGNQLPDAYQNTQIESLAAMPNVTFNNDTSTIEVYDSSFSTKLLGSKSVNDIEIVVNYIPDNPTHAFLDNAVETQQEFQLIIQYQTDEEGMIDYSIINGQLSARHISGDKDAVVQASYTFSPKEVAIRSARAMASIPLVEGSYGVGSNGVNVPQYQPDTPAGNSFIKIPASSTGNPAGADVMGIGLIDQNSFSSIALTKSGALAIYAKNGSTAWTRIVTSPMADAKYLPFSGGTISGNLNITGILSLTNALTVANGGTGATTAAGARTNLDVYSKSEVDAKDTALSNSVYTKAQVDATVATLVPKTTTVNGKALSSDIVINKSDVGLSNVTNDAQLKVASNLSDVPNKLTARTNLGLGESNTPYFGSIELSAVTPFIDFHFNKSSSDYTTRLIESSSGTLSLLGNYSINNRLNVTGLSTLSDANITGLSTLSDANITGLSTLSDANVTGTLTLTNALAITSGGTGASTVEGARSNLGLGTAALSNIGTSGATIPLLNTVNTWSAIQNHSAEIVSSSQNIIRGTSSSYGFILRNDGSNTYMLLTNNGDPNGAWNTLRPFTINNANGNVTINNLALNNALAISNGGTGATTAAGARTSLGLGTAAVNNIGTSGYTIPLLSTANTWTSGQTFNSTINVSGLSTLSNASITGTLTLTNALAITSGGTGANNASSAWLNLLNGRTAATARNDLGVTTFYSNGRENQAGAGVFTYNDSRFGWNETYATVLQISNLSNSSDNVGSGRWQNYLALTTTGNIIFASSINGTYRSVRVWSSNNTTVDGSGFIKQASPIIRVVSDVNEMTSNFLEGFTLSGSGSVNSEAEGVVIERTALGVYKITGSKGLHQDGWQIEVPKDVNGNRLCFVKVDTDKNNVITLNVFKPKLDIETGGIIAGAVIDIPTGRWVDIRLEM